MDYRETNRGRAANHYVKNSVEEVKIEEEEEEEEEEHLLDLFPDFLTLTYSENQLLADIDLDFGSALSHIQELDFGSGPLLLPEAKINANQVPKQQETKKRGRPRKTDEIIPAKPIRKCVASTKLRSMRKQKKKKCMTPEERAQHNQMEKERRKGMALLLERLRELVPTVKGDRKASQKKIVDEATSYLRKETLTFLSYLKEKQLFLRLEARRRQLERELSSGPNGFLCVWEDRKGMSSRDLYKKVRKEAKEDLRDEEIDEAIIVLESSLGSPESSPDYSDSSAYIEVEV